MSVAVIIPVFNRAQVVLHAIRSVLSQTFQDFELIVIDDGSLEDLSEAQALVEGSGHQFIRTHHVGVAHARNVGLKSSSAEWIALLDSDDRWLPKKLERQLQFLGSHPACRFMQSEEIWYRHGKRVNPANIHRMPDGDAFERSVQICCISSSSAILHRSLTEQCGIYDERFPVCEDYELWLRLTAHVPIGLLRENLTEKFGGAPDQLSKALPLMDRYRCAALIKFLRAADSSSVSEHQANLVWQELERKTNILLMGAEKRDSSDVEIYRTLLAAARDRVIQRLGQIEDVFLSSKSCL